MLDKRKIMETKMQRALRLPFLGSRQNGELFEYLLLKMNPYSALIAIPDWLLSRTVLKDAEKINLHLRPFFKEGCPKELCGYTTVFESGKTNYENLYRIQFVEPFPASLGNFEVANDVKSKLILLIKDSFFLKNGILVYLKHLIPFFTRILKISKVRYRELKDAMLDDIQEHVEKNMLELKNLYKKIVQHKEDENHLPLYLDLEKLRNLIQSEVDLSLFQLALDDSNPNSTKKFNEIFAYQPYSARSYRVYLNAIKTVEHRLYDNYNCIVKLYTDSFNSSFLENPMIAP